MSIMMMMMMMMIVIMVTRSHHDADGDNVDTYMDMQICIIYAFLTYFLGTY